MKVQVTYDRMVAFANHAKVVGTQDQFIDLALDWMGQADKELKRQSEEIKELNGEILKLKDSLNLWECGGFGKKVSPSKGVN